MNGDIGTILRSGRLRLMTAVAALLASPCLARPGQDARKGEDSPPRVAEVTQDDLRSRVPNFFYFDYQFEPQPGKRLWLRVDGKRWVERYPDGMETRFRVHGRASVQGIAGTIVVRQIAAPEGGGVEADDLLQVFIPDRGGEPMQLLFRTVGNKPGDWGSLGEMKKVE